MRDELGQGKREGERTPEKLLSERSIVESEERRPREGEMEPERLQRERLSEMTRKWLSQRTPYQEQWLTLLIVPLKVDELWSDPESEIGLIICL